MNFEQWMTDIEHNVFRSVFGYHHSKNFSECFAVLKLLFFRIRNRDQPITEAFVANFNEPPEWIWDEFNEIDSSASLVWYFSLMMLRSMLAVAPTRYSNFLLEQLNLMIDTIHQFGCGDCDLFLRRSPDSIIRYLEDQLHVLVRKSLAYLTEAIVEETGFDYDWETFFLQSLLIPPGNRLSIFSFTEFINEL